MSWFSLLCYTILAVFVALYFITRFIAKKFFSQHCRVTKVHVLTPSESDVSVRTEGDPSIKLSIVIPMYNEVTRLPEMMDDTLRYVTKRLEVDKTLRIEIVFVDDCSVDETVALAKKYVATFPGRVTGVVVGVNPNRGKGYAVRQGVFASSGQTILMADADGAAPMVEVDKLFAAMDKHKGAECIAVGSRAHLENTSVAERTFIRTLLMHVFHFGVSFTFFFTGYAGGIKDTQCGFKLFTRKAAMQVFSNARIERWAFDVELLIGARHFKIPIEEVAINWHEVGGSKLSWKGMVRTGLELILVCFAVRFQFWTWNSMF